MGESDCTYPCTLADFVGVSEFMSENSSVSSAGLFLGSEGLAISAFFLLTSNTHSCWLAIKEPRGVSIFAHARKE